MASTGDGDVADADLAAFEPTLEKLYGQLLRLTTSNRTLKKVVGAMIVMGVAFAVVVVLFVRDSRNDNAQRSRSTTQARYSTCVNWNVSQKQSRDSKLQDARDLFTIAAESSARRETKPTPAETAQGKALMDEYLALKAETNKHSFPYRNCSPDAIARYYAHPPADPATAPEAKGEVLK